MADAAAGRRMNWVVWLGLAASMVAVVLGVGFTHVSYDAGACAQAALLIPVHVVKAVACVGEAAFHLGHTFGFVVNELLAGGLDFASTTVADDSKAPFVPKMDGTAVVITGASSGIGEDVALLAAGAGARLLLAARRIEKLSTVAARCRDAGAEAVHVLQYDATKPEDAHALVSTAVNKLGGIDVLVLNAGTAGPWSRVEDLDNVDVLHWLMEVNYWGYVRAAHAAIPHLITSKGRLVAVGSFYGRIPAPFQAGYSATKHAVNGFFDTLRPELARHGVSVTLHLPGGVKTEVQHKFLRAGSEAGHATLDMPSAFLASSRDCAASIIWAAFRRAPEAYFPLYAGLAAHVRHMFPSLFDTGFTHLVSSFMESSTFTLTPHNDAAAAAAAAQDKL